MESHLRVICVLFIILTIVVVMQYTFTTTHILLAGQTTWHWIQGDHRTPVHLCSANKENMNDTTYKAGDESAPPFGYCESIAAHGAFTFPQMKNCICTKGYSTLSYLPGSCEVLECKEKRYVRPPLKATRNSTASWQAVTNSSFVFSAFYDGRNSSLPMVRILGMHDQHGHDTPCYCLLWYASRACPTWLPVRHYSLWQIHAHSYQMFQYACVMDNETDIPYAVTLTSKQHQATNVLHVQNTHQHLSPAPSNFTVCYAPLFGKYSNTFRLIENIELNRLMGADRFFIYVFDIAKNVENVVEFYKKLGIAEVISWNIPINNGKLIHYYGQNGMIQDCIYRAMYTSHYVVLTDLDEIIVPRHHTTWQELLNALHQREDQINSYLFRHTAFILTDTPVNYSVPLENRIRPLTHLMRSDRVWSYERRSKYIANPRLITFGATHVLYKKVKGSTIYKIPQDMGLLFHYRDDFYELKGIKVVKDPIMLRYRHELLSRIEKLVKTLNI